MRITTSYAGPPPPPPPSPRPRAPPHRPPPIPPLDRGTEGRGRGGVLLGTVDHSLLLHRRCSPYGRLVLQSTCRLAPEHTAHIGGGQGRARDSRQFGTRVTLLRQRRCLRLRARAGQRRRRPTRPDQATRPQRRRGPQLRRPPRSDPAQLGPPPPRRLRRPRPRRRPQRYRRRRSNPVRDRRRTSHPSPPL